MFHLAMLLKHCGTLLLRVTFVLRSTEVHPVLMQFVLILEASSGAFPVPAFGTFMFHATLCYAADCGILSLQCAMLLKHRVALYVPPC